jgi:hypothetical protein
VSEYNLHQSTQAAIEAFEDVERTRLLLDKKEHALKGAVVRMAVDAPEEDREPYHNATEAILRKFEDKRDKAGLS